MKVFTWKSATVLLVCLFIGGFFGWLVKDEPLGEDTKALLVLQKGYQPDLKEHPYFIALGFDAKEEVDPMVLGRLRYHQDWLYYFQDASSVDMTYSNQQAITKRLMGLGFDDNIKDILSNLRKQSDQELALQVLNEYKKDLQLGYQKYDYLILRYQDFLNQPFYEDLSSPLNAAWVDYATFMNVHYLYVSKLAFENNISALQDYINTLSQRYSSISGLVQKIMLTRQIESTVELLNSLLEGQSMAMNLAQMEKEQLAFRKVFGGEMQYVVTSLPHYQDYLVTDFGDQEMFNDNFLMKIIRKSNLFYLPNMTINQIHDQYVPYIELSELPYKDFKQRVNQISAEQQAKLEPFKVKNFIGNILVNIGTPDWSDYVVRARLLDNKIRVFNILHHGEAWDIKKLNQNKEGYEFYQTDAQLCIRNPYLKHVEQLKDSCLAL